MAGGFGSSPRRVRAGHPLGRLGVDWSVSHEKWRSCVAIEPGSAAEIRSNVEGALPAGFFFLRIDMHLRRTRSSMLFLVLPQVVPAAP